MAKDHYEIIARFTAKALALGVESREMEHEIKRECTNKYIEEQIRKAKEGK